MARSSACPSCAGTVPLWDVYKSSLPSRIRCRHCGARLRLPKYIGPFLAVTLFCVALGMLLGVTVFLRTSELVPAILVYAGVALPLAFTLILLLDARLIGRRPLERVTVNGTEATISKALARLDTAAIVILVALSATLAAISIAWGYLHATDWPGDYGSEPISGGETLMLTGDGVELEVPDGWHGERNRWVPSWTGLGYRAGWSNATLWIHDHTDQSRTLWVDYGSYLPDWDGLTLTEDTHRVDQETDLGASGVSLMTLRENDRSAPGVKDLFLFMDRPTGRILVTLPVSTDATMPPPPAEIEKALAEVGLSLPPL